jgi:hypothetical protein
MSSPPSRSQMCAGAKPQDFTESGFGGWADEKMKTVREAAPMLSPKEIHPQHLTISRRGKLARDTKCLSGQLLTIGVIPSPRSRTGLNGAQ